jgi:hypothetical protein
MADFQSNGLHLEFVPFGLEQIRDYEPGGYHPVHLAISLATTAGTLSSISSAMAALLTSASAEIRRRGR